MERKAIFLFDETDDDETVILKFNLWARSFFPNYFTSPDALIHEDIDWYNLMAYRAKIVSFVNIAFRGAAKTSRTKLFVAYCIANDEQHKRRYFKVLSNDPGNATQIVTDIYNMLISHGIVEMYPNLFVKTNKKREEQMGSFTTATGIKVIADSIGVDQRGAIQEDARPDYVWFEDFENRTTLRSRRKTKNIWENMEEARTGLAYAGACVYTCNYLSESGNVHKLVQKAGPGREVLIAPIEVNGHSAWPERYTDADIAQMRIDDDEFEAERNCRPSALKDVFFDRDTLDKMGVCTPVKNNAGFKIFKEYNPSHRYGSGHDVSGGVGLDSSTSVFIDFTVSPAQVVATFRSNTVRPDNFGDEVSRESDMFGGSLAAIEINNHGHATLSRARQLGVNLYETQRSQKSIDVKDTVEYGWHTNHLTKSIMLADFAKAITDHLIELNDPELIAEAKAYTRNDMLEQQKDPRLFTDHFDLLTAACIAWQTRNFAKVAKPKTSEDPMAQQIQASRSKPRIIR